MKISLIQVPWDSGHFNKRMGKGPRHLAEQGLVDYLKASDHSVELTEIKLTADFITEMAAAKRLNESLSKTVKKAKSDSRFPIVLAGNCNTAIGTIGGLGSGNLGLIWFDAHADFNTPETTTSGFFDGMGLSILTGNSWKQWRETIPGLEPLNEERVILIGAREIDYEEQRLLHSSSIRLISVSDIKKEGGEVLADHFKALSQSCREAYIHIDLDVLDPLELRANEYFSEGGLFLDELKEILKIISVKFAISAISFASYDPDYDSDNKAPKLVKSILDIILGKNKS